MDNDKHIDESWKDSVAKDKEVHSDDHACGCGHDHAHDKEPVKGDSEDFEVSFFNYIASMGYQAMIFLGEVPNPMTNQVGQNLRQAKFLIDTIALISEKTRGNLSQQEDQFLSGTLYELQMKYVDISKKGKII